MIATSRTGSQVSDATQLVRIPSRAASAPSPPCGKYLVDLGCMSCFHLFPGKAFWGFENITRKNMHFQHENCLTMTARKQAVAATDLLCIVP